MEKNKIWIWRAIDGVSCQVIGCVLGDHTDRTLKKLIKKIDNKICTLVTDNWEGYYRILPENRYITGKDLTYPIEKQILIYATDSPVLKEKQKPLPEVWI